MTRPRGERTAEVSVTEPIDVDALCQLVAARVEGRVDVVVCDVRSVTRSDISVLDTLAWMQLTARRLGGSIQVVGAPPWLVGVLEVTGLSSVIAVAQE